jgi:hypothetical protein
MKNMSSLGLLWIRQWSSKISESHVIHSNFARHGLLYRETWRSQTGVDEDCALSTVEGSRTFRWHAVPSSWTVGPEHEKLTIRQGTTSQMTWIFSNTAVIISQPPTVVPKHWQETTDWSCANPKRAQISFTLRSKPEIRQLWKCYVFCYQRAERMHRLRLAWCFLCCVVHVYAGHFGYKKITQQQEQGRKK